MRIHIPGVVVVLIASAVVGTAARRPATTAERNAIARALPKTYRASIAKAPAGCVTFVVRVSANGRFAEATPRFSSRAVCVRYASDGFFLLRRTTAGWKTIYNGSDEPPCSLSVPRDLIACAR